MKKLWIAFIVVATLGSIYPFNFQASELGLFTISTFLKSCCGMPSRGDILGNVILFIPIGFTGMFAARLESSVRRRFFVVCLSGTVIAFALQVMQIFLPSRDANLQDVVWNLFGIVAGAVFAGIVGGFSSSPEGRKVDVSLVPMTLVGTWLIYRLIPFVPSLDLQLIKDSLKPVLDLQVLPITFIHDVTAWVIVGYLLQHVQRGVRLDKYLPLLVIAVFCLEIVIVDNSIGFSNVLGAILAIFLWWAVLCNIRWQEGALVILLLATLVMTGLAPFDVRFDSVPFNWFPFHGFLGGSMYINTQSAAEKVFLYGSLVFLLWRIGINAFGSILIGISFVAIVEFAQTRFVGHTPEITDPLLVIFAALTLLALERHENRTVLVGQLDTSAQALRLGRDTENHLRSSRSHGQWSNYSVNLRKYQFDFLARLSTEMEVSVSRVIRRIIAQFIEELERDAEIEPRRGTMNVESGNGQEKWITQIVNLRRHQVDFLVSLSQEVGTSVSNVTRQIIERFIAELETDEDQI